MHWAPLSSFPSPSACNHAPLIHVTNSAYSLSCSFVLSHFTGISATGAVEPRSGPARHQLLLLLFMFLLLLLMLLLLLLMLCISVSLSSFFILCHASTYAEHFVLCAVCFVSLRVHVLLFVFCFPVEYVDKCFMCRLFYEIIQPNHIKNKSCNITIFSHNTMITL